MKTLYLLTESDTDDLFYEACAERMTGAPFTPVPRRLRQGGGITEVRKALPYVLSEIKQMQKGSGAHLLIALDNDRAPHAAALEALSPEQRRALPNRDSHKQDRYAALLATLHETLGYDHSKWPIPVAIAIPVEMLETWLLLTALGGQANALPRFAWQDSDGARQFHGTSQPPPQLKDLTYLSIVRDGFPNAFDWIFHLVFERLDPIDLANRSASFALFKQCVDQWPHAATHSN
ncbi:MAG: hypothetical protein ABSA12_10835 [Verrucomicrobiia bacterium]|jgi:hypothetical protein